MLNKYEIFIFVKEKELHVPLIEIIYHFYSSTNCSSDMLLNPYVGAFSSKITHIPIKKTGDGVVTQTSTMLAINRLWSKNENHWSKKSKTGGSRIKKTKFALPNYQKQLSQKCSKLHVWLKGKESQTHILFSLIK